MKRPNFFIVGAPKCGTTSMHQYLGLHPDIFFPTKKEPNFFCTDLDPEGHQRDLNRYLALFEPAVDEKRVGEASVWYLYSEVAAAKIKNFCPDADIIVMLRNPVEMIYSLHAQRIVSGHEDILDFEDALAAEDDRRCGRRLPKHGWNPKGLLYRDTAKYTDQIERYFAQFGREHVHIIIYNDFQADTAGVYKQALDFLQVNPDFRPEFKVMNANQRVRNRRLHNFLRHSSPTARTLVKAIIPRQLWLRIGSFLTKLNNPYVARPPMRPELREQLRVEFEPEVRQLSALLGRDLSRIWN